MLREDSCQILFRSDSSESVTNKCGHAAGFPYLYGIRRAEVSGGKPVAQNDVNWAAEFGCKLGRPLGDNFLHVTQWSHMGSNEAEEELG